MTYHRWRGTEFSDGKPYADVPGFCYSAKVEEVHRHGFVLTPGRYVGANQIDEDDEGFASKMDRLTAQVAEQMARGSELDDMIRNRLSRLDYAV